MVLRSHTIGFVHRPAEAAHPCGLATPLLFGELTRLQHGAGGWVAPHLRNDHDVLTADGRGQLRHILDLLPHRIPRIVLVQVLENGPCGELQIARREFVGQLLRIGRKIAVRAQFDPLVAGFGHLIKEAGVGRLVGVVGEPHAPRVGC